MNFTKSISIIFAATLATACASVGNEQLRNETETSINGKIIEGSTTKAQIRSTFGSPLKTSFTDGGLEVATYEFTNVSADAISFVPIVNLFGASASGKKKELVVLFDKLGVVQRYSMSESEVTQKTGLFNK
ncbi:MAG: hypothetical protein O9331_20165 [Acidovorax sp.]|nr:hypothetical protein [Acidovorax sp.]